MSLIDPLARMTVATISPAGERAKLSIFIFHRVLEREDPLFPGEIETCNEFEQIMSWISGWFNVLPLRQAVADLEEGALPARAACITFDDGYADNLHNALPILQRLGLHATFFIATGFLDGGRMWNDTIIEAIRATPRSTIDTGAIGLGRVAVGNLVEKRSAIQQAIKALKHLDPTEREDKVRQFADLADAELPDDLMLTTAELQQMHEAGMGIGAHTVNHPILAVTDDVAARLEIEASRDKLESILGTSVDLFAYPNGKREFDYDARHVDIVRDLGFAAAVSTNPGVSRHGDSTYELPRFSPWDRRKLAYLSRTVLNAVR